jgi:dienelactone hydrolase
MGLRSEWVQYGDQQQYSGFLVLPEGPTPLEKPAVLVIQEIWGVDASASRRPGLSRLRQTCSTRTEPKRPNCMSSE